MLSCASCRYLELDPTYLLKARMSGEPSELDKFVKEVLKKIMADRSISKGIQASSTRGLRASPLIGCHSSRVNPITEK